MSIVKKAFKGASWLALSRLISQSLTWIATIIIARILVPEDYGLMEMATILTGYVILFSELGLGAAIIQREDLKDQDLSSLFWFVLFWGIILGLSCLLLAYPTVSIFNEERVFNITQSMSVLFILGALIIIPRNILRRELKFKTIGIIDAIAAITSSILMIIVAELDFGVWTFITGWISRELIRVICFYTLSPWKPKLHYNYKEIKPFLKFGMNLAAGNSLYYVYSKSDSFFAGRNLGSDNLGNYSLALQLSSLPTEKLVHLLNSVSYPVFAKLQNIKEDFNEFYLKLTNLISFIVFPIFAGGIIVADLLIPLVLGEKWMLIIFPFKLLCIAQIIVSMTTINAFAHNAQGRPNWNLYFNIVNTIIFPPAFFWASKMGLNYLVIPWITINPLVRLGFTYITLKKLDIRVKEYLISIKHPSFSTIIMAAGILLLMFIDNYLNLNNIVLLIILILAGALIYIGYFYIFNPKLFKTLINLFRHKEEL